MRFIPFIVALMGILQMIDAQDSCADINEADANYEAEVAACNAGQSPPPPMVSVPVN